MFSKLKKLVRDNINNSKICSLTTNITNSLTKITSSNLYNFFVHSFSKLRGS